VTTDQSYEKTTPLPPAWTGDTKNYVKDTNEWIARCLGRVQSLDPVVSAEVLQQTVRDLASLERWRVLKPEDAAEQLYRPVVATARSRF
jgi:hypothetical protein